MGNVIESICRCHNAQDEHDELLQLAITNPFAAMDAKERQQRFMDTIQNTILKNGLPESVPLEDGPSVAPTPRQPEQYLPLV